MGGAGRDSCWASWPPLSLTPPGFVTHLRASSGAQNPGGVGHSSKDRRQSFSETLPQLLAVLDGGQTWRV